MKKHIKKFTVFYIILVSVLAVLAVSAVFYVISVLKEYEANQPEKTIEAQMEKIVKLAKSGSSEKVVSFKNDRENFQITPEEKTRFESALTSEKLTYKLSNSSSDGKYVTYKVMNNKDSLLYIKLKSLKETTKLSLFTYSDWSVEEIKPILFNVSLVLPNTVTVSLNGNTLTGSANDSGKSAYNISAFGTPELLISDVYGNVIKCNESTKIEITEYKVTVPDNFTLQINGKDVAKDKALASDNKEYDNLSEYGLDMPKLLCYDLAVLKKDEELNLQIYDPNSQPVSFTLDGNQVKITEQPSYTDSLPDDLAAQINPMQAAINWSLFMTNDLEGAYHGFYTLANFLQEDSYLYNMAWKFANSIDITFTSTHSYPEIANEKLTKYTKYTDNCFSCDVYFEKNMLLNTGKLVTDVMNSRFYFVNTGTADAPNWVIGDIKEIID